VSNSNLNFYRITNTQESFDWDIRTYSLPTGVFAAADFPGYPDANGVPGYNILVNESYIASLQPPIYWYQVARILMHEIGHLVGFRHTDWDYYGEPAGPYGAIYVPGTPNQDAASVFNKFFDPYGSYITPVFSQYDIAAIQTLYPLSTCNLQSYINLPSQVGIGALGNAHQFSYGTTYNQDLQRYTITNIEVQVIGVSTTYNYTYNGPIPEDGYTFPSNLQVGQTYKIRMRFTNFKGCTSNWGEKNITII
jgi:hypothetical protein